MLWSYAFSPAEPCWNLNSWHWLATSKLLPQLHIYGLFDAVNLLVTSPGTLAMFCSRQWILWNTGHNLCWECCKTCKKHYILPKCCCTVLREGLPGFRKKTHPIVTQNLPKTSQIAFRGGPQLKNLLVPLTEGSWTFHDMYINQCNSIELICWTKRSTCFKCHFQDISLGGAKFERSNVI